MTTGHAPRYLAEYIYITHLELRDIRTYEEICPEMITWKIFKFYSTTILYKTTKNDTAKKETLEKEERT